MVKPRASVRARSFASLSLVALVVACGGGSKPKPVAPTPTVTARCPDLTKPEEVGTFDFAKEFVLSRDAADKLKAAALGATELASLDDKLDAELGIACSQIANALGDKGSFGSGAEACTGALKAVRETRAKLGQKAQLQLVVRAPICQVDESLMTKCAAICDSSVPPEKSKAECEQKVGRCDGQCEGVCESKNPQKCEGTCSGACEGAVKGTCGGRCKGTCDGRPSNGTCAGECRGTCAGGAFIGECKGQCNGACKFPSKGGICDQLCAGKCSVDLADAKCAGSFKTPDVSTDCRARCDLAAMNKSECGTPQVGLVVTGATNRGADEALRGAVERSYPALLKILFEAGEKGGKRVLNAEAVFASARGGLKDMAASGGKATAAASEAQLVKCFDEPFKKAAATAQSLKTLLDQAQGLRDDVSK